jgi:hypothetical protein
LYKAAEGVTVQLTGIRQELQAEVGRIDGTSDAKVEADRQEAELMEKFTTVLYSYGSFADMLGTARGTGPAPDLAGRPLVDRQPIVLANNFRHPLNWATGRLVATFSRDPNPHNSAIHYYTHVNFEAQDKPAGWPAASRFVRSEMFGNILSWQEMTPEQREKFRDSHPGLVLQLGGRSTPEAVEELRVQLETLLPDAQDTFNLLLEKACDPDLNPDLVLAAQAYRANLPRAS